MLPLVSVKTPEAEGLPDTYGRPVARVTTCRLLVAVVNRKPRLTVRAAATMIITAACMNTSLVMFSGTISGRMATLRSRDLHRPTLTMHTYYGKPLHFR